MITFCGGLKKLGNVFTKGLKEVGNFLIIYVFGGTHI